MNLARTLPLLLLMALPCLAAGPAPSAAESDAFAALAPRYPGHSTADTTLSFGDLNGDGVDDFAVLLTDANGVLRVVVYRGKPGGGYAFFDASGDVFAHPRAFITAQISRGSLFLHRDGSGGCCSHWSEDFQFKQRRGLLMLIGVEIGDSQMPTADAAALDSGTSANMLTGDVIHWTQSGEKRTEKKSKNAKLKPMEFKDFDYNRFTEEYAGGL